MLYFTSLQTEEGQFIKVTVTLIDHLAIPESDEDEEKFDAWKFFPFKPKMNYSIKNLVKLSKAADPWSSSLAVFYDTDEELFIYGMIDQSLHYQSFLNYEREEKPDHPGIIQVMIAGIGILEVMLDYQKLATLNQNSLVKNYLNVFEFGPIAEFLRTHGNYTQSKLAVIIGETPGEDYVDAYNKVIAEYQIQAISRILLKIRNYHHGGAILVTKDFSTDLDIKYNLRYNRIALAVDHLVYALDESEELENKIKRLKRRSNDMPIQLHEDCDDNELDIEDGYNEMIGAIRFVSSLSCVDGLVVLSPQLRVHGFGTVITQKGMPEEVLVSKTSRLNPANCASISPGHYGTRHRSMFAYCLKHPDSVGFVVSQDGEIRAIKGIDGKLYMWENIKIHQFQRSNKLPRPMPPPPPKK